MVLIRNLAGALALAALVGPVPAAQEAVKAEPVVVTTGEATSRAAPDRAFLSVTTETRSRNPREAQRQNAEAMTSVQQRLAEARLPKDAIRTVNYDLQPEFDYVNGRQTPRGYVARNTIEVRLDEVARVGEILDLAVSSGATGVSQIRFDLSDREAREREALKRAVADARARAEAAAAGAGRAIDRIVRIEEARDEIRPQMQRVALAEARVAADTPDVPIRAGEIEIHVRVRLTASIK